MSEDYSAQLPIATWNTARGVWEKLGTANLFCEHWELFSETWQISGTMRNGQVFELPMPAHLITDSESSSLPTPTVADQFTANLSSTQQKPGSLHSVSLAQIFQREDLFPTPKAQDGYKGNTQSSAERQAKGFFVDLPNVAIDLMPTPNARDGKDGSVERVRDGEVQVDTIARTVLHSGEIVAQSEIDWGKFEPGIRRWESIIGRAAPSPTKPDGRDNTPRLSSAFTEWLMGLPEGWVTDVGLTRNEELKACGNGVVPQQAELALRLLLNEPQKGEQE